MKKIILGLMALAISLSSCTSVVDKMIEPLTIEANVQEIIKTHPELDSATVRELEALVAINKGRIPYRSFVGLEGDADEYMVSEEKFNEQKDSMFNYFKAQQVSFSHLIAEADAEKKHYDQFEIDMKVHYEKIDSVCMKKQKLFDERDKEEKEVQERLNKMVDIKILSIRETNYDYRDAIEVKIKLTNKTSKPIEAIGFALELTDKLGYKVATLNCTSQNRFLKSTVSYWSYDRWERSDIYKALKNTKVSHVSTTKVISRINLDGELISSEEILTRFLEEIGHDYLTIIDYTYLSMVNRDYKTPDKPYGYCPYIGDDSELMIELEKAEKKSHAEIDKATPILTKIFELKRTFSKF